MAKRGGERVEVPDGRREQPEEAHGKSLQVLEELVKRLQQRQRRRGERGEDELCDEDEKREGDKDELNEREEARRRRGQGRSSSLT